MGRFGSFFQSVHNTVTDVVRNPTSSQNLQTIGLTLFTGVPIDSRTVQKADNQIQGLFKQSYTDQKNLVNSEIKRDPVLRQGVRDLKAPLTLEGRQQMAVVGSYVVIAAVVVVICVYSLGTGCAPAVGAGITLAATVNGLDSGYKAELKAKDEAVKQAALAGRLPATPFDQQVGGAGGAGSELLAGNFDGLFTSLDPNTAAGMKTIMFLGAVGAVTATAYFGFKYLRK